MIHRKPDSQRQLETEFERLMDLSAEEQSARITSIAESDPDLAAALEDMLRFDTQTETRLGWTRNRSGPQDRPRLGLYTILHELGSGGMGTVYLAEQTVPVRRNVALKVIRGDLLSDQLKRRFELERDSLARMNHPGIPKVFEAGESDSGQLYFAMEFVDGVPITDWCARESLGLRPRLELFIRVCHAVQHAHDKSVIHRDIKPSNVLVSDVDGVPTPKLIDFGIARASDLEFTQVTSQGQLLGTPEYMSPEQVKFDQNAVDTRTDVYSLGLLLFELLTNQLPLDRVALQKQGLPALQQLIVETEAPRPSSKIDEEVALALETTRTALRSALRGDLDNVVQKALEKDPDRRYNSPIALAEDLERCLNDEPVLATRPSPAYLARKFARRHRRTVVTAIVFLILMVLGLVGTTLGYFAAVKKAQEAERNLTEAGRVTKFLEDVITAPTTINGREKTLREAIEAAAPRIDENYRDDPRTAAIANHVVGRTFMGMRDFPRASQHLSQAVSLNQPFAAESAHRTTVQRTSYQILSEIECRAHRYEKALELIEAGLALPPWPDDRDEAARRGLQLSKARVFADRGELVPAEEIYRAILSELQDTPQSQLTLVTIQSDLATLLKRQGRLEEAEALFRNCLSSKIKFLGENHAMLVSTVINHAAVLRSLERYDEAEAQYKLGAQLAKNHWGEHSPELANSLHGLGHVRRIRDRRLAAREAYEQALQVVDGAFGAGSPAGISIRNSLGSLLLGLGEYDLANQLLETNLNLVTDARYPGGRSHQILTYRWIADLRIEQERYTDADELIDRALEVIGDQGWETEKTWFHMAKAEIARSRGEHTQAREHLTDSAELLNCPEALVEPRQPVNRLPSTGWLCSYARHLRETGDPATAVRVARHAYERLPADFDLSSKVLALFCWQELASPAEWPQSETEALLESVINRAGEEDPWVSELRRRLSAAANES